jgi:hypothetical protein
VLVATQEAETGRLTVQSQPEQIVRETQSRKIPSQKRAGGVAQGVSPVFKSQYQKKKNKKNQPNKQQCACDVHVETFVCFTHA